MRPGLEMSPDGLGTPADRFTTIGKHLKTLSSSVNAQATSAGQGAGTDCGGGLVTSGCDVFAAAIEGALAACSGETTLLGNKVAAARVGYSNADASAARDVRITDLYPPERGTPPPALPGPGDRPGERHTTAPGVRP